jgi:hypothetical protein
MPGKRHHYVPQLMLDRFAVSVDGSKPVLCRLEKKTGANRYGQPVNEAVIGRYYRATLEDGTTDDTADEILDRIESDVAPVIERISDRNYDPTADDVSKLLLFVVTLKQRTPRGREALREANKRASEMHAEMVLSDAQRFQRTMAKHGDSAEEAEATRLKLLGELRGGRLEFDPPAEHELGWMFIGLDETAEQLFHSLGVVCVRIPDAAKARFVLSDHPVAHYDPTPKMEGAGAGFISSPKSVTWVPLDPRFGLLLTQERPYTWLNIDGTAQLVENLNLLTYGWANDAVFGSRQDIVTEVRRCARQDRKRAREFEYRPPRVWVSRVDARAPDTDPQTFSSRFRDDTRTATLAVTPEGVRRARRDAWGVPGWGDDDATL